MKKAVLLLFSLFFTLHLASGQEAISQNSLFAVGHLNSEWSYRAETHVIRGDFFKQARQLILRPAITYNLTDKIDLSGGISYLYNASYENGPSNTNEEFNSWEQLGYTHELGQLKFSHWLRIEQRHREMGYSQRLRYRINISAPINVLKLPNLRLVGFNEHFVHLKNFSLAGTDQNWTFFGVQFPINEHLLFRSGYRYAQVHQQTESFHLNTLHSWLIVRVL